MKLLFLVLFFAATIGWGQPRWMMDDDNLLPFWGKEKVCKKLDLSAEQEKQFDKLLSDMQKKQIDLNSKIQSLRIDIKDMFKEESPDKSKIESKMNEINKLQGEMKKNHLEFWFAVNKILKPEQQKIWKEHHKMMDKKFGMKMKKRDKRFFFFEK